MTNILLEARLPNGKFLVHGKKWTGIAASEEYFANKAAGTKIQPLRIDDEAHKMKGTTFVVKSMLASHAI